MSQTSDIFFMAKDELYSYAKDNYQFLLDIDELSLDEARSIVASLYEEQASKGPETFNYKLRRPLSTHIMNTKTGKIFPYSDELLRHLESHYRLVNQ